MLLLLSIYLCTADDQLFVERPWTHVLLMPSNVVSSTSNSIGSDCHRLLTSDYEENLLAIVDDITLQVSKKNASCNRSRTRNLGEHVLSLYWYEVIVCHI